MKRPLVLALLCAAATGVWAIPTAAESTAPVTVKPKRGSATTTFVVSFTAPDRSGRSGSVERHYVVSATGPSEHSSRCVDEASKQAPPSKANQTEHVKLQPGKGHRWCLGKFDGSVDEIETPNCERGSECPLFVVVLRKIGTFRFRVSRDTLAPQFGGLQGAVQCFPGPSRLGEQRPVGLSWNPARDNATAADQIKYDIYMSSSSGDEDFASPSWTTVGKTSFETPNLPPGRYFVVRARDKAGNEDHNRVERQAENPCV